MCMKKFTYLLVSFIFVLVVAISGATAKGIQPSGKAIAEDKQGHSIYRVQGNGIEIGYKLIGSGEPLVMIMGLGGTMDRWPQEVIETLSKNYQLIIPDNRGMGYTTANETTFTYKLFADDVIALLDALQVQKVHVLGFSMGSTVAQELLLEYPQRLNKAIIYATSIDGSNVVSALEGKTPDDPIVLRQIEATTYWKTPLDKLPSITNQVLFVIGTSDTVAGVESTKTIATAIPGAWLVQFKNATHLLMEEVPEEFARVIQVFLDINETVAVK